MDIRSIDDSYSVTGQIEPDDLEAIKAAGFRSLACHRPDDEQPGQPAFAEIADKAAALGLEIVHIPVGPSGLTPEAVTAMVDALDTLPRPMLGYCRSGARSTAIYQATAHIRN